MAAISIKTLGCMGTPPPCFQRETIFVTSCLLDFLAPMGAKSFLYEMTPFHMGGNENNRVASPESVLIHLNFETSKEHKHRRLNLGP